MKNIFTIPNIISLIRLLIIPLFVSLYFADNVANNYVWAIILVALSGFSDLVDGFIARRFNMISDLGKILDPIADKLTQVVVLLCLSKNHPLLLITFVVLFVKEAITLLAAVYVLTNGTKPISARWWGKLSSMVLFATMLYTVLTDILEISLIPIYVLIPISVICMLISVLGYFKIFSKEVKGDSKQ